MLINKKACKIFALGVSAAKRNGKFTRVSGRFFDECEAALRHKITDYVQRLPSVGKTIK